MKEITKGQCLCQAVTYEISSQPKEIARCFCKTCQIKSGSDQLICVAYKKSAVAFDGPVKWYADVGDSKLAKEHGFCSECGTTLFGTSEYWPDLIVVYAGSLLDNSQLAPQANIWVQQAPPWSHIDNDIPCFDKNP